MRQIALSSLNFPFHFSTVVLRPAPLRAGKYTLPTFALVSFQKVIIVQCNGSTLLVVIGVIGPTWLRRLYVL